MNARCDRARSAVVRSIRSIVLLVVLACASVANPAWSQTATDDEDESDTSAGSGGTGGPSAGVEEILIIGEVLETSTQAESEAITTFDQSELDSLGIADVDTLALNTPSLHVGQVGQQAVITLRGIGLENLTAIGEAGVGFQVDGVHLARPAGSNAAFFDLENVSVDRGPVGTRGGRNSNGGRISLWSAKPTEEFDLFGDVKLGNYESREYRAVLNLPLYQEFLMTRTSVIVDQHRGYTDIGFRTANPDDLGDADEFAGRFQLRSLLFDQRLETRILTAHSYQRGNGPGLKLVGPPPSNLNETVIGYRNAEVQGDLLGDFQLDDFVLGACPTPLNPDDINPDEVCVSDDERETFSDLDPDRDNEQNNFTALITWDMPFFDDTPFSDMTLGAVGSWFQNIEDSIFDFDGTNIPDQIFDLRRNSKQKSLELFLERADVGSWDFRTGVHLFTEDVQTDLCFDAGGRTPILDLEYASRISTRTYAFFGEFGFRPTEALRVFGGARYTRDTKRADERFTRFINYLPSRDGGPAQYTFINEGDCGRRFRDLVGTPDDPLNIQGIDCCTRVDIRPVLGSEDTPRRVQRFGAVTPMIGFEWQASDANTLGFSVTRGFKSGGFPLAVSQRLNAELNQAYDSEFVTEFELSSKNEFFDGLFRANLTAFWTEYDPFQICQFNGPVFLCRSDGSATIRGGEFEWRLFPLEGLQLNGHFNYTNTRVNKFQIVDPTVRECRGFGGDCPSQGNPPQSPSQPRLVDVSGNELPKAPRWAGSFGIQYDLDLGGYGIFTPRVQTQFQSRTFFRVFNKREFSQEDYAKYDAKVNWLSEDGRFFSEIFVTNLTDEDILNSTVVGSSFTGGQVLGQYQAPRTYGVRLGIRTLGDLLPELW
jgi:iron complex outermembrane receptor protein